MFLWHKSLESIIKYLFQRLPKKISKVSKNLTGQVSLNELFLMKQVLQILLLKGPKPEARNPLYQRMKDIVAGMKNVLQKFFGKDFKKKEN